MSISIEAAKHILSKKNSGPSGVLAYVWANTSGHETIVGRTAEETYGFNRPYKVHGAQNERKPYYAVVETDRSGLTVVAPPGGTQDILFELDGESQFAELAKSAKQQEFIRKLTGVTVEEMTDELFVAHLLQSDRVTNVELESAFDAAVRETAEEHGWNYTQERDKSRRISDVEEELLSKRSFQSNPPKPISQNVFVVETDDFDGVVPAYTAKTETKIPSMLGNEFYEKGNFMSLDEISVSLGKAKASVNTGSFTEVATHDYLAAKSRFEMMQRIEARILSR